MGSIIVEGLQLYYNLLYCLNLTDLLDWCASFLLKSFRHVSNEGSNIFVSSTISQ